MHRGHLIYSLFAVLCALGCAVSSAFAWERCVLVELHTGVGCLHCPKADAALDSLAREYPDDSVAIVRYHKWTGDPFQQPECTVRGDYYGVFIRPTACVDGVLKTVGAPSESTAYVTYKANIEARLTIPSSLRMDLSVTYDTLSRGGQASVQVVAVDLVAGEDLHLRYALVESGLVHEEDTYQEVLRDMYPDASGVSFTIAQGDTFGDTQDFSLDPQWLPENCDLVVFVQDDATKEVLQSIHRPIPLPQVPDIVEDLQITLCESQLFLTWLPVTKDQNGHPLVVDYYRIFRDTSLYFFSGDRAFLDSTEGLSYLDTFCHHVGDPQKNCSYYVTAVAGGLESTPSRVVGEFDHVIILWK